MIRKATRTDYPRRRNQMPLDQMARRANNRVRELAAAPVFAK
jgi:hypothetical protein